MTVSTTIRKAGPFAGTGLVSSYPFAFKVFTDDDLLVIRTPTGGADVTLVLASDYTVTLNPDQDTVPGGSVVLSAPLAVGYTLSIGSQVDSLQGLSLTNNGGFFPKAIENALDKLDIQDQQQEETLSRAVRVPFGSGAIPDLPAPSAGSALVWNALGTALENGTPGVAYDTLRSDLAGTGSGQGASQIGVQDAAALLTATTVEAALAEIATRVYGDVTFVATGGDDSTALQTFIDANKGKRISVRGDCTFAGVTLSGSAYNGTRLDIQSHKLSVRPTSGTNTFGGAYVGLLFKDCDACELTYRGDGQRSIQPDEQHIYLVGMAGVSNMHVVKFHAREIRGDGMYVSQSSWTSSSTTTTNLVIDDFKAYNSADDGRNALSLIAYDGVTIGTFQSIAVGGVVDGVRMPGGLDVEPNFAYQTCNSLTIGSAVVRSQGTTCFGIQGKDAGSEAYCVTGFSCGSLDSINTLGTSATTGTWAFNFFQAADIQITGRVGHTINTHGLTGRFDSCIGVQAKLKVSKSFAGIAIGESGWVRKSHIDINITEYAGVASGYGVRLVGLSDCRVTGHVSGAQNASSTFAVQFRNNSRAITQTNNRFSIDAPKDSNNARGYRNESADLMVFSNCQISDCNVTGYGTWNAGMDGFGVAGIRKVRVFGWSVVSVQPTDGGWTQGDFVEKTNPTKDASNMAVYGWLRITTGTGAVSGTDWSIANVSHVSPAT